MTSLTTITKLQDSFFFFTVHCIIPKCQYVTTSRRADMKILDVHFCAPIDKKKNRGVIDYVHDHSKQNWTKMFLAL